MIAQAIDKIISLSKPDVIEINGEIYTSRDLRRKNTALRADSIFIKTLSGLIEYMAANQEKFDMWKSYFLHVKSEVCVELVSDLDSDRMRETIVTTKADTPDLPIGRYINQETFLIGVQANFIDDKEKPETDLAAVLKFAGSVTSGTITDYKDDGVTQKATVRVGISSKAEAVVPSPARLRPYRTFTEVAQPASEFIFRMQEGKEGPLCALIEADGGAWKKEAMQNIKEYLVAALEEKGISVPVIA